MVRKNAKRPAYPLALETRYQAALDARVKGLVAAVVKALETYDQRRADALNADDIRAVIAMVERVGVAHESEFIASGPKDVRLVGSQLTQWQDGATAEFIGDLVGIAPASIRRFFRERPLTALINKWAAVNVGYVQAAEADFLDEVQAAVVDGLVSGRATADIAQTIEKRGNVARSRARLIARDQLSTLNQQLTQERQTALGVEEYQWVTALDERVRPDHQERHGKTFRWDSPPSDGHPGRPINCRCVARPVAPPNLDLFK